MVVRRRKARTVNWMLGSVSEREPWSKTALFPVNTVLLRKSQTHWTRSPEQRRRVDSRRACPAVLSRPSARSVLLCFFMRA